MFRQISALIFLLFTSNCIAAQDHEIEDAVAAYFAEIQEATTKDKNLWDINLYGPMLLVKPDTRQAFSNYADLGGILKKSGKIFTGILPDELNIANTAVSWSGGEWAMIMLPLSDNKKVRINLLAHELFHRAQTQLGFTVHNSSNNHLNEKEGRALLRLELEALKKSVLEENSSERKVHLTNAFVFRKYRHLIYSDAAIAENILELNEGLAEYSGVMISRRNHRQMQEHFTSSINNFFNNPSFVRSFAYITLPVYGYLLLDSTKDWNKEIDENTNLTEYFLNAYKIHLPKNVEKKVSEIKGRYNGKTIYAEEVAREERTQKIKSDYMNKFVHKPHLEIHFEKMSISFDPRNIVPLDALGTVYPNIRVTDNWGILTVEMGALMSSNWSKITVSRPTEIMNNEISGDGWKLELKDGYTVKKDETSSNYVLTRR